MGDSDYEIKKVVEFYEETAKLITDDSAAVKEKLDARGLHLKDIQLLLSSIKLSINSLSMVKTNLEETLKHKKDSI